jgi:c-di-GMP phosphodiesterase
MSTHTFLNRQPIFDSNETIVYYDLFYMDRNLESEFIDDRYATATVLTAVLNNIGVKTVAGDHRVIIKADHTFLLHELIFSIPKELFIIAILEYVELTNTVIERIRELYERGYTLALNDLALTAENIDKYAPILNNISLIKVDTVRTGNALLERFFPALKAYNLKTIATQLETKDSFKFCKTLGFDYFEGYYFAKPVIMNNASLDAQQIGVLHLISLLMGDTNIDTIVIEFEKNYSLTIQLLKFINSGAFHFREKLTSIKHILTLLGRQKLAQWLMLMIYAKSIVSNSSMESPLLLLVKNRTEMMHNLLLAIVPNADTQYQSQAYFVAVLSLSDTLFGVPISMILDELNVDEQVRKALLQKEGMLGEIYALIRDIESVKSAKIVDFIERYSLENDAIEHIVTNAMRQVNELEASLKYDAMANES